MIPTATGDGLFHLVAQPFLVIRRATAATARIDDERAWDAALEAVGIRFSASLRAFLGGVRGRSDSAMAGWPIAFEALWPQGELMTDDAMRTAALMIPALQPTAELFAVNVRPAARDHLLAWDASQRLVAINEAGHACAAAALVDLTDDPH